MWRKLGVVFVTVSLLVGTLAAGSLAADIEALPKQQRFRVATTTSLYDTGLWSYLEPMFEEEYGVELDIVYAGTGIALEYGRRGDVDAPTIRDKAREEVFVADDYGTSRNPFAYNYFIIIGPPSDPAGIKGMLPEEAFVTLLELGERGTENVKFVSRGDASGTHGKEKAIWTSAGIDYEQVQASGPWYVEAGRGMGPTLLMAGELDAYTLSDMGTFLTYQGDLNLIPVVDEGDILLNVYSAIPINPEKHPNVNIAMADNLVEFLLSDTAQEIIDDYGLATYGTRLFRACKGSSVCN